MWYDRAPLSFKNKLESVVRYAEKIIGTQLPSLQHIYLSRLDASTKKILKDEFHPASIYFEKLPSGRRYRAFKGNKRFLSSFYPQSVKFLNGTKQL